MCYQFRYLALTTTFTLASEGGREGVRDQTKYISPEDLEQIERGKGALNQLWSLYRNNKCWKTEKEVVSIVLYTTVQSV